MAWYWIVVWSTLATFAYAAIGGLVYRTTKDFAEPFDFVVAALWPIAIPLMYMVALLAYIAQLTSGGDYRDNPMHELVAPVARWIYERPSRLANSYREARENRRRVAHERQVLEARKALADQWNIT